MSARQAVIMLQELIRRGESVFRARYGSRALSAVQDMASLAQSRLTQEFPPSSLWADFETDAVGMAPQLTGMIEALIEADPAFGRRLEGFVRECHLVGGSTQDRSSQPVPEVLDDNQVTGTTLALKTDDDVGKGAYLYGNLKPGAETPVGDGRPMMNRVEGVDHIEVMGITSSRVTQLLDDMYAAIGSHPGIERERGQDLKTELEKAMTEVIKGDAADADRMSRHLRRIGQMHPDVLQALLERLADPEAGWAEVPPEFLNAL